MSEALGGDDKVAMPGSIDTMGHDAASHPFAPPPRGGIGESVWRAGALRDAAMREAAVLAVAGGRLARARQACELADRTLDPIDALKTGPSTHLAVSLYREAAYFALASYGVSARDLPSALEAAPRELVAYAAGGADRVAEVRAALVDRTFVDTVALHPDEQRRDAIVARDFVHALLDRLDAPHRDRGLLLVQRWTRIALIVATLASIAIAGTMFATRKKPNLAAGKPWQTSSSSLKCSPAEHSCGGATTDILFHTNDEENPWYEVDLGVPTSFSSVSVTNRSDCCPDRAAPMVIEVSDDRVKWREVAKQLEPFSVWRAKFAPTSARYVRTRVLKRTILHLEEVAVHK